LPGDDAVAALALGGVEGAIGGVDEGARVDALVGAVGADAEADGDGHGSVLVGDGSAEVVGEVSRDVFVHVGEEHAELFAAVAADEVGAAYVGLEGLADVRQDVVAGGVAVGVVDLLEVIDVGEHEREGAAAASLVDEQRQAFVEGTAVWQPGDGINDLGASNSRAARLVM
jgi:hypothetical protein